MATHYVLINAKNLWKASTFQGGRLYTVPWNFEKGNSEPPKKKSVTRIRNTILIRMVIRMPNVTAARRFVQKKQMICNRVLLKSYEFDSE